MKNFSFVFAFMLLFSSCAPAAAVVLPTETSTATIVPTSTDTPTPSPTFTPTVTPTPQLPVLAGTPFPQIHSVISQENVARLSNIVRWGTGEFIDADYTPDMKKLIVVTVSSISYYDTEQGTVIWSKEIPVFKAKISNSGNFLAVAVRSGIELWDANNGLIIRKLEGIRAVSPTGDFSSSGEVGILRLDFSPDDKYLGVRVNDRPAGNDYSIYLWNPALGEPLTALSGESFGFSPDSSLVAISAEDRTTIRIYKELSG